MGRWFRGGVNGGRESQFEGAGHEVERAVAVAVDGIANDRKTLGGAVDAELMGAAGAGAEFQPGC